MDAVTRKYHEAAIAYLVYGLIYLGGALYLAARDIVARSGWVWFAVGVAFILVLPPLIWYGYKWLTRILAVLVGVRIVGLARTVWSSESTTIPMPWGGEISMRFGAFVFLLVAVLTAAMLVRAGWGEQRDGASSGA